MFRDHRITRTSNGNQIRRDIPSGYMRSNPLDVLLRDYWISLGLGYTNVMERELEAQLSQPVPPYLAPLDANQIGKSVINCSDQNTQLRLILRDLDLLQKCYLRLVAKYDNLVERFDTVDYLLKKSLAKIDRLSDALAVTHAKRVIENRISRVEPSSELFRFSSCVSAAEQESVGTDKNNHVPTEPTKVELLTNQINSLLVEFQRKHKISLNQVTREAVARLAGSSGVEVKNQREISLAEEDEEVTAFETNATTVLANKMM